ncbi:unnamed protein product [Darwinula stevensoni]|uniref:EGF-like domain-containing protein n=1 Tax=Darwinula stevensoni TaxID=69355 RepID=A0A7R8X8E7_9CRUS|nr:unnamed protein product [Darwinula stevensoni]CAG0883348.1 unnamed protein product [Darwinula stevensoni]
MDRWDDCGDGSDEPEECAQVVCAPGQYQCGNNHHCIHSAQICDGKMDCEDGSDEKRCEEYTCLRSQFKCPGKKSKCIPLSERCDGEAQCPGMEDEEDCGRLHDCADASDESDCLPRHSLEHFMYAPRTFIHLKSWCIPPAWKCDADKDCGDGSDEDDCEPKSCASDEHQCDSLRCIPRSLMCDGVFNCEDLSDELNCNVTCQETEFKCASGQQCILKEWRCDGEMDCADESDEENCPGKNCSGIGHDCRDGRCIPFAWRCDGRWDCHDNSDELPKLCAKIPCPFNRFRCKDHKCILISYVCNGERDCDDGSDETPMVCKELGLCGHGMLTCKNGRCIQEKQKCDHLDDCGDNSDEDDCDFGPCSFGACSQVCKVNREKQDHTCSCVLGYIKVGDECIATGPEAFLFLLGDNMLFTMSSHKRREGSLNITLIPGTSRHRSHHMDILYHNNGQSLIYWSDTENIYRREAPTVNGDGLLNRQTRNPGGFKGVNGTREHQSRDEAVVRTSGRPQGLSVEWITGKVYWVDSLEKVIRVSDLNGNNIVTLINTSLGYSQDLPQDIVVDPHSGWMFWTNQGLMAAIGRARLNGNDSKTLVSEDLLWPSNLAIDYPAGRLYWTDSRKETVETVMFDGKNRQIFKIGIPGQLFIYPSLVIGLILNCIMFSLPKGCALDVFEDKLYITSCVNHSVYSLHKFGKNNTLVPLTAGRIPVHDIVITQMYKQRLNLTENPCENNPCPRGALCLLDHVNERGYSCHCSDGAPATLDRNQLQCGLSENSLSCGLDCNAGKCILQDGIPKCQCPSGIKGPTCLLCDGFKCLNSGTCHLNQNGTPSCKCPSGFTGVQCMPGFHGRYCEETISDDPCINFCENGGVCSFEKNKPPQCWCLKGWTGNQCKIQLGMRACSNYCHNNGKCHLNQDLTMEPVCECPLNYYGKRCDKYINPAVENGEDSVTPVAVIWSFVAGICLLVLLIAAVMFYIKKQRKPFMHIRMEDGNNLEINNPIYLQGDDEEVEDGDTEPSFSVESHRLGTFSNPVYDSVYCDGEESGNPEKEEKRGLLQSKDELKVEFSNQRTNNTTDSLA